MKAFSKTLLSLFYKVLGWPIALLWEWIYRLRRFLYTYDFLERREFYVPIISVGNLTFGGTGKTPFTVWLGKHFHSQNKKVMVLTRGYKGRLENRFGILKTDKKLGFDPYDYGDEAILIVKKLKNASVVVGKRRSENLEHYFSEEKPDVVLLDDGHQHIQLKRRLNIVLFDSLMPLERYKVAPLGYLREGLNALKAADFVVLGRADQVSENHLNELKNFLSPYMASDVPVAHVCYRPSGLFNLNLKKVKEYEELKGQNVIAVCGIATPESFLRLIRSSEANITDQYIFPDHHSFSPEEMDQIVVKARETGSLIVTTEKDIVKMRRVIEDDNVFFLEVDIEFLSGEDKLINLLEKSVRYQYV